jgi:hypothetical protein
MHMPKCTRWIAAALMLALGAVPLAAQSGNATKNYQVTITNLTGGIVLNTGAPAGQVMSPPAVATHNNHLTPIFMLGHAASPQLAAVAEEGQTDGLVTLLSGDPSVMDVEVGSAPILPGASASIMVHAAGGFNRISLAGMLVTTNDGFYALNGVLLPGSGSVTYYSPGYDAGSERDSELCEFIPGPPCGSHNVRDTSGAPGYVFIHSGIHGVGDLEPAQFDWRNPVAKITITALGK